MKSYNVLKVETLIIRLEKLKNKVQSLNDVDKEDYEASLSVVSKELLFCLKELKSLKTRLESEQNVKE